MEPVVTGVAKLPISRAKAETAFGYGGSGRLTTRAILRRKRRAPERQRRAGPAISAGRFTEG